MTLAEIGDYFGYGVSMVSMIAFPAAGLVINIAGMQRRGLNRWAGIAACLYFANLLIQGTTGNLAALGAFSPKVTFWLLAGTLILNFLGGLLALFALWQIRRKHRWPRGRKRAIAVFWLNVITLGVASVAFYLRINPKLTERIFG
jgi:hypothetical protein